jgi:hypothetical protein
VDQADKRTQLASIIQKVDGDVPSPDERAAAVWLLLRENFPDLTDWDVLCFASGVIAMLSQSYPWLEKDAKSINGLIHTAHYMLSEDHNLATGLKRASKPDDRGQRDGPNRSQENGSRADASRHESDGGGALFKSALHIRPH